MTICGRLGWADAHASATDEELVGLVILLLDVRLVSIGVRINRIIVIVFILLSLGLLLELLLVSLGIGHPQLPQLNLGPRAKA